MKALTLWQPYATLLALGGKQHETRTWPLPALHQRKVIAIHAAKRPIAAEDKVRIRRLGDRIDEYPLGAIVGWAVFDGCFQTPCPDLAGEWGDYGPGRWVWQVLMRGSLYPLHPAGLPCTGRQGVWTLPAALAGAVKTAAEARMDRCAPRMINELTTR